VDDFSGIVTYAAGSGDAFDVFVTPMDSVLTQRDVFVNPMDSVLPQRVE
jgi:hypothetical protein